MSARVLKLPRTAKGRAFLRDCVRSAGGWDFPDGSNAADFDWDIGIIEADRMYEEYEQWCKENGVYEK